MDAETADRLLASTLDGIPLDALLRALNRASSEWAEGRIKSDIDFLKNVEAGHPIFDWMAAEAARCGLLYCPVTAGNSTIILPREESIHRWSTLETVIARAVDVHLNLPNIEDWKRDLDESIWGAMGQIWFRQYTLQRRSPFRVAQALLLYDAAPRRRAKRDATFQLSKYQQALESMLGGSLHHFLFVLLQTHARSKQERPELSFATLAPVTDRRFDSMVGGATSEGVYKYSLAGVLRNLAATPATIQEYSDRASPSRDPMERLGARLKAPNPLWRYPLVRCHREYDDHCIAPVPHLVLEWLYEPMANLLAEQTCVGAGRSVVATIFEEYVGLIADQSSPDEVAWHQEQGLLPRNASGARVQKAPVVDWAREFSEYVVLIDAKRCYVSPESRLRWRETDWSSAKKAIARGVAQGAGFWREVQSGSVAPLRGATAKQPLLLLVMLGDVEFYVNTEEWRRDIADQLGVADRTIPWICVSLDMYERLMSAWHGRPVNWLPAQIREAATGASLRPFFGLSWDDDCPLARVLKDFIAQHVYASDTALGDQVRQVFRPNENRRTE
jgi:hypothetical protein